MAPGEQANEHAVDDVLLADNHFADFPADDIQAGYGLRDLGGPIGGLEHAFIVGVAV
jgi:hypothetical protein